MSSGNEASAKAAGASSAEAAASATTTMSSEFPDFLLQRIPVNVDAASTVVALEVVSTYGSEMVQIAERLLSADTEMDGLSPSSLPDYCALFLRAVTVHADLLFGITAGGEEPQPQAPPMMGILLEEEKSAATVIKAIGYAATQCASPSDISQSGIIPVLATLAVGGRFLTSLDVLLGAPPPPIVFVEELEGGKQQQQYQPPSNELFTLVHAEFLQCCMAAGHYRLAGRFLKEHPVRFLRPLGSGKPSEEELARGRSEPGASAAGSLAVVRIPYAMDSYLKYFYLAGTIYMANEEYREAQFAFQVCLSTPAKAVSAIVIAARKRLILCRCALLQEEEEAGGAAPKLAFLEDLSETEAAEESDEDVLVRAKHKRGGGGGSVLSLPSATPTVVMEYMDGAASEGSLLAMLREEGATLAEGAHYYGLPAYYQLALAFEAGSVRLFSRIRRVFAAQWKADGNVGFLQKCADVFLPSRLVRWRLARVYQVTSLETVARTLQQAGVENSDDPEHFLLRAVDAARRAKAPSSVVDVPTEMFKVDHVTQMVYFDEEGDEEEEEGDDDEDGSTEFLLHPCMDLARRVRDLDVSLSTMGNYQLLAAAAASKTKSAGGATAVAASGPRGVTEI